MTTSLRQITAHGAEDRAGAGLRWGGLRPAPARSFMGEFPPRIWTLPMDEAEEDVLAYMTFPKEHRPKLHSTNPIKRLNGEIKRRT